MNSQLKKAQHCLAKSDPVMATLVQTHGPCTLFSENAHGHQSGFHTLVWAIINQQLSVASARSIEHKLQKLQGESEFEAQSITKLDDIQLASCGLSKQKIRYLRALCAALNDAQLDFDALSRSDDSVIATRLSGLPGIGPWTVDMYLMFSLGRLDVLPLGDLALRKAIGQHYPLPDRPVPEDYHRLAECWRPYRSVASWYLWASVD